MSRYAPWPVTPSATTLGVRVADEDCLPSVRGFIFEVENGVLRVTQVNTDYDETYADHAMVSVPFRVWRIAAVWIAEHINNYDLAPTDPSHGGKVWKE